MIYARDICLSFTTQKVFDHLTFTVNEHDRIGLVGLNGSGKSTLLKIIAQQALPDSGTVTVINNKKIAYLPQDVVLLSSQSVIDEALTVFGELDPEEIPTKTAEIKKILMGLGFNLHQMTLAVDELSVGWKMKLVLAKLLLQKADFYLFDEPTNHLDIFAQDWFLHFLSSSSCGFLLVCHERYFLDELCTKILELERAQGKIYQGNYTDYQEQKAHDDAQQEAAYIQQQKELAQKKATIERFRASATKAKMAQSMIKALDKIERIAPPASASKAMTIKFPEVKQAGKIVLTVEDVGHSFEDKKIFENVSFTIERQNKVALVAANGVGKTTLFNLIIRAYPLQKGHITLGYNVDYAVFNQDQNRSLSPNKTIWEEVEQSAPQKTHEQIRGLLGAFLFSNDSIRKKINVLSGGEKNRVAMAKVLLHDANFLLLDEPTNHLDIQSKERLLAALKNYQGTILFVSHDHDFINKLATQVIELTPQGTCKYDGNFDAYLEQKNYQKVQAAAQNPDKNSNAATASSELGGKDIFLLRKNCKRVEEKIEKNEYETARLHESLGDFDYGTPEFTSRYARLTELYAAHKQLTAEWEKILLQLETN